MLLSHRKTRVVISICSKLLLLVVCCSTPANADIFGSGSNTFEIDFIKIGDPGNAGDSTASQVGAVAYSFRLGLYEISEDMIDKANALGGIGIEKTERGPNKPATQVDWFEAARFVNWLNTSTGNSPAYNFNPGFGVWTPSDAGYNPANRYRNTLAKYFLPTFDEWHKAAFYDPASDTYFDYANGSNSPPTPVAGGTLPGTAVYDGQPGPADIVLAGGPSPFGTIGQNGNVREWQETDSDRVNDNIMSTRVYRGGHWNSTSFSLRASVRGSDRPSTAFSDLGFRVASVVPEPSCAILLALAALGAMVLGMLPGRRRAKLSLPVLIVWLSCLLQTGSAQADVFNMSTGLTSLAFVPVGNPGNPPDTEVMTDGTSGYGSVPYAFRIGTFEVTAAQYTEFLNAHFGELIISGASDMANTASVPEPVTLTLALSTLFALLALPNPRCRRRFYEEKHQ